MASGVLQRLTQRGNTEGVAMEYVPARVASQKQVCEDSSVSQTNSCLPDTYPAILTVSSTGEANSRFPQLMGEYIKILGKFRNGRPVWKHKTTNAEFYYEHLGLGTLDNYWIVQNALTKLSSKDKQPEDIPVKQWDFWHENQESWVTDDTLTVKGWFYK